MEILGATLIFRFTAMKSLYYLLYLVLFSIYVNADEIILTHSISPILSVDQKLKIKLELQAGGLIEEDGTLKVVRPQIYIVVESATLQTRWDFLVGKQKLVDREVVISVKDAFKFVQEDGENVSLIDGDLRFIISKENLAKLESSLNKYLNTPSKIDEDWVKLVNSWGQTK